ncbi:hypothetical protein B0J17DRAFT_772780 [Rhizoctonia solani]|nr:hypothetical protein B0J17DRAFT_772780 [Rhizoctonia solani]
MSSVSSYNRTRLIVHNNPPEPKAPSKIQFEQRKEQAGLLCTTELEIAAARCKAKVEAIIQDCRARNSRFRDLEFDLEEDKNRCLYGLVRAELPQPADVLRVSQIFEEPQFFIDGANTSDVVQGSLDDRWFLSAVSTITTMEGLINRICVHRDEEVGVYGFVFYCDSGWVDVIIDDLLFTRFPRYEELLDHQKTLYHGEKDKYETGARVGGQTLLFARSKTQNETWLPLLEKAFAKLHGDYQAITKGFDTEAIEALTGGISTLTPVKDILNVNKLWKELLNVDKDRLFGCTIDGSRASEIAGLFTSCTYTVLGAMEVNGKRFVRLHNPWGKSEWKGPWSDGSKEWTSEWLDLLPELNYEFGDDGQFLMEYKDFLRTWTTVERSRVFGADWKKSSMWLNVASRSYPCAWSYGDVSFTFSVTEDSPAAIVLSRLNDRAFEDISGYNDWSMDFVVYRKGASSEARYVRSNHNWLWQRVASVELDNLEAGDYVLHVRLDREHYRSKTHYEDQSQDWDARKLSKVWTQAAISKSVAVNFVPELYSEYLPVPEETFAGEDLSSLEARQLTPPRPQTPTSRSQTPTSRSQSPITVAQSQNNFVQSPIIISQSPIMSPAESISYPPLSTDKSHKRNFEDSEDHRNCPNPKASVKSEKESTCTGGVKSVDSEDACTGGDKSVHSLSESAEPQVEVTINSSTNDTASQHLDNEDDEEFYDCEEEIAEMAAGLDNLPEDGPIMSPRFDGMIYSPPIGINHQYIPNGGYQPSVVSERAREERPVIVNSYEIGMLALHSFLTFDNRFFILSCSQGFRVPRVQGMLIFKFSSERLDQPYSMQISPIEGTWYRCLSATCPSYNICEKCMRSGPSIHDKTHKLLVIHSLLDSAQLKDRLKEEETNSVTLGLRIYTKGASEVKISGQLRQGSILSWEPGINNEGIYTSFNTPCINIYGH